MNQPLSAIPTNDAARPSALAAVISEQRAALERLRKDSDDLAEMVADEVLERFEREVEDHLGETYDHELAQMVRTGLCSALSMAYEESFERHVLARIQALRQQIEPYLNNAAFYVEADVGLRSSWAGLKLWQDAGEWIDDALKAGRPSVADVVGSILGDWFGDPVKEIDRIFRELKEAAKRARRAVLALRPPPARAHPRRHTVAHSRSPPRVCEGAGGDFNPQLLRQRLRCPHNTRSANTCQLPEDHKALT